MKFSHLPDNSLFRIVPGHVVHKKITTLYDYNRYGFVNAIRLGDAQTSGCGPDVDVVRVHRRATES